MIFKKIEKRIAELEKTVREMRSVIDEMAKPTISKATTKEDKPLTTAEIYDEWLNGKEA